MRDFGSHAHGTTISVRGFGPLFERPVIVGLLLVWLNQLAREDSLSTSANLSLSYMSSMVDSTDVKRTECFCVDLMSSYDPFKCEEMLKGKHQPF